MTTLLHARAVTHRFRSGRVGIDSIDLDVTAGETVALVGPNGSGKTTLLRMLAGLLPPTSGRIVREGDDAASASARSGWAPDAAVHFDELTGRQNAEFFALACGAAASAVQPLLDAFGLAADADVPVARYSFGMRRKLMLVQAMAHSPALLFMDEPTVGLDPGASDALRRCTANLAARGSAIILATNDLIAARSASRIVFLHRARMVADATPAGLLSRIRTRTQIDFALDSAPQDLPALEMAAFTRTDTGVTAAVDDTAALPALCQAILEMGAKIREIRIREPDLSDVFRELTGEEFVNEPVDPDPAPPRHRRRAPPWRKRER
jgi:ABC-2 type transport system ATP-binding protein